MDILPADRRGFWLSLVKSGWNHVLVGSGQSLCPSSHPQMSPKEETLLWVQSRSPFLKRKPTNKREMEMKASIRQYIEEDMKGLERRTSRKEADQKTLIQRLRSLSSLQEASVTAFFIFRMRWIRVFWLMQLSSWWQAGRHSKKPIQGRMEFDLKLKQTSFDLSWNQRMETQSGRSVGVTMIHVPGWPKGWLLRLGYGGGPYDRYLAEFAGDRPLHHLCAQKRISPAPHDIPVKEGSSGWDQTIW